MAWTGRLLVVLLAAVVGCLIPATANANVDLLAGRWSIGAGAEMDVTRTGDHQYTGTLAVVGSLCPPVGQTLFRVSGAGTHFEGSATAHDAILGCGAAIPDGGVIIDLNATGTVAQVELTIAPGYTCDNCGTATWTRIGAPPTEDDGLPWWFYVAAAILLLLAILATTTALRARRRRALPPGPMWPVQVGFHPRPGPPVPPSVHTGPTPGLSIGVTARLEPGQVRVLERTP